MLLPFRSHVGSTTFTIEGTPALAAIGLAVVALALLVLAIRRASPRLEPLHTRVLAAAGVGAFCSLLGLRGLIGGARAEDADRVASIFALPVFAEHTAIAITLLVAAAGAFVIVKERRAVAIAIACVATFVCAIPIAIHARALERTWAVPHGVVAGAPHMHLGKTRELRARLVYADGSEERSREHAATVTPARVVGDQLGPKTVTIRGRVGIVDFESIATVTVAAPRASHIFPLAPGLVQTYRGGGRCTYEDGRVEPVELEESITVSTLPESDGLTLYQVKGGSYIGHTFQAYAADGETYWIPSDARDGAQAVPVVKWDRASRACEVTPWSHSEARCRTTPDRVEGFNLKWGTTAGGQVAAQIFTLGLWKPERSRCEGSVEWSSETTAGAE